MPAIRRQKPVAHDVVVDSNILWHKDKAVVVSPDFEEFWRQNAVQYNLHLVVPETVRGELLFQQTSSALKLLGRANEALSEAAGICEATYRHRVSEARVRRDVERRFDAWLKRKRARVIPPPYADINWQQVASAAIWRTGPFAPDAKNPDAEKGFRDALILEAAVAHASHAPAGKRAAFVCNDATLREATSRRLSGIATASTFESLGDLASYLRLSAEELTQAFVLAIRHRAREKFHTSGDPQSLYLAGSVWERIRDEHASQFGWFGDEESTHTNPFRKIGSLTAIAAGRVWEPISREVVWLDNPEFARLHGKHEFHWTSSVRHYQLFRRAPQQALLPFVSVAQERLRTLHFSVQWHSVVRADGRFRSMAVDAIVMAKRAFDATTTDELSRLRVDRVQELSERPAV